MDPELARLAKVGAERGPDAPKQGTKDADWNMRVAVGAFRGSFMLRAFRLAILLSIVAAIALAFLVPANIAGPFATLLGLFALTGGIISFALPPIASPRAVAAERRWLAALPFPVGGYFEALNVEPHDPMFITYEIRWARGAKGPDPTLLSNVIRAIDAGAILNEGLSSAHTASLRTGPIDGASPRAATYSNDRLPAAIHPMIERALVVLHHTYPIEIVTLKRGDR